MAEKQEREEEKADPATVQLSQPVYCGKEREDREKKGTDEDECEDSHAGDDEGAGYKAGTLAAPTLLLPRRGETEGRKE